MKTEGINWWTKPWAILGAIGFISVLKNVMVLPQDLAFVIDGFRAVSRPVMEFLLGWLFDLINIDPPGWVLDYFTLGLVVSGAHLRTFFSGTSSDMKYARSVHLMNTFLTFLLFFMWPIIFTYFFYFIYYRDPPSDDDYTFLETFLYAAIILAVAYALAFGGVQLT